MNIVLRTVIMHKDKHGNIGFNSKLEHRLVERVRYHLKKAGIFDLKTSYHDNFVWIMTGNYAKIDECDYEYYEPIRIHILMRSIISDKVAMNLDSYNSDRLSGVNSLLILVDRRYLYPVKFMFFNNINEREYKDFPTPHVLILEKEFENINSLKDILEQRELS